MLANGEPRESEEFEALSLRFRAPLIAYFLHRVGDRHEAEDLAQDVFVRLANRPESLESADAYVFTIAANLLKDRARKRQARQSAAHLSLDDNNQSQSPNLVEDRDPQRVLLAKEELQEVTIALEALGERTRDIFILARLERMRQREIAALFGISVGAVEKHVAKAAAHLGARFQFP